MTGWQTLLYKEVLRFWKVGFQTVAAPVLTADEIDVKLEFDAFKPYDHEPV